MPAFAPVLNPGEMTMGGAGVEVDDTVRADVDVGELLVEVTALLVLLLLLVLLEDAEEVVEVVVVDFAVMLRY